MIRILLVDDQALVRSGIRGLLALVPEFHVVGEASDGLEGLQLIEELQPDVVLLDVRMPHCSGVELLRRLSARGNPPPSILLTTFDDGEALLEGVRAGAKGFLLKDIAFERLAQAIRSVAAGGTVLRPGISERARHGLVLAEPDFPALERPEALSAREQEVLALMAGGYSNAEISEFLGTTEGTVKNQVSSILAKLGVRDRVRAILKALELGIY